MLTGGKLAVDRGRKSPELSRKMHLHWNDGVMVPGGVP